MIDSTINLINLVFIVGVGSLIFAILGWCLMELFSMYGHPMISAILKSWWVDENSLPQMYRILYNSVSGNNRCGVCLVMCSDSETYNSHVRDGCENEGELFVGGLGRRGEV